MHPGFPLNDLHVFDSRAAVWTDVTPATRGSPPSRRYSVGLAIARGSLFVFGGRDQNLFPLNDLFQLNLNTMAWVAVVPESGFVPSPQFGHRLLSVGELLYCLGSANSSHSFTKLLQYDPAAATWTDLTPATRGKAPPSRRWQGFAEDNRTLHIFSGAPVSVLDTAYDNFEFQIGLDIMVWSNLSGSIIGDAPSPRKWLGTASISNSIFVFGGIDDSTQLLDDTFMFDSTTMAWTDLSGHIKGARPPKRSRHGFASSGFSLYVFGGAGATGNLNDLFRLDVAAMIWTDLTPATLGPSPAPRNSHGFAAIGDKLYVFGGGAGGLRDDVFGDLFVFDTSKLIWTDATGLVTGLPPPPRLGHGLSVAKDKLYVFSGWGTNGLIRDLFMLDPSVMVWSNLSEAVQDSPLPRLWLGFAAEGNKLYIYGGFNEGGFLTDFYQLDLVKKEFTSLQLQIKGNTPFARYGHGCVVSNGWLFLVGGTSFSGLGADFQFIRLPRDFDFPANGSMSGFIDIYDWDTVFVPRNKESWLQAELVFCTSILPCSITLLGDGMGSLRRKDNGALICMTRSGCSKVIIEKIDFLCDNRKSPSLITAQGSYVSVRSSSFSGCTSYEDGSTIRSFDGSVIIIYNSRFIDLHSNSFGGAIASVGSFLRVVDSEFLNCSSKLGGGAIWASSYICYGSTAADNTTISIEQCKFSWCSSLSAGGAIMASSDSMKSSTLGQGVHVSIHSSWFRGCTSNEDGGTLSAVGTGTYLSIGNCSFSNSRSGGSGGILSAADSSLSIESSEFVNSSSDNGGGCIWVSSAQSASTTSLDTNPSQFRMVSSLFGLCTSLKSGGAVAMVGNPWKGIVSVSVFIDRCRFVKCASFADGGGLAASGGIRATVSNTTIVFCRSVGSGGAVLVESLAAVAFFNSSFLDNSAEGTGGGALCIHSARLFLNRCSALRNSAVNGGGGALLWNGEMMSPHNVTDYLHLDCIGNNTAVYGPCAASKYHSLQIKGLPINPVYPGLSVSLNVFKVDVYNQTILTDSATILRTNSRSVGSIVASEDPALSGKSIVSLTNGVAAFDLQVSPVYSIKDYEQGIATLTAQSLIYFQGIDSEGSSIFSMQSEIVEIPMANGSDVCPAGYILVLDSYGHGTCTECRGGTYSVSPLAGQLRGQATCFTCPHSATCIGGSNVVFSLGVWVVAGGMFRLIGCPQNHQLLNSINGVFNHDIQQCVACQPGQYILNSNSSEFACQSWNYPNFVTVSAILSISSSKFSGPDQLAFANALAKIASVSVMQIMVTVTFVPSENLRRLSPAMVQLDSKIGAENSTAAAIIGATIDSGQHLLSAALAASGLPSPLKMSVTVTTSEPHTAEVASFLVGTWIGSIVGLLVAICGAYYLVRKVQKHATLKACAAAAGRMKPGDPFRPLPTQLQKSYIPEVVVGCGAFACIVRARMKRGGGLVAIKIICPGKGVFDESEIRQLKREEYVLQLFASSKCEHAVRAAGIDSARIEPTICWFVMDLVEGKDFSTVLMEEGPVRDSQCIKVAQSMLAALKVMHAEGVIHRDIKPANIMRCHKIESNSRLGDSAEPMLTMYHLVDFGLAIGVDEDLAEKPMMTLTSTAHRGLGTPPYMSPEMFLQPNSASYPTDIWSLGVTMFELVVGELPFEAEGELMWGGVIGNMGEKAPNVLDRLRDGARSTFDNNLAQVIRKALEKPVQARFQSADDMHAAVFACLIAKGEAYYSAFISYRVASEEPLARILFDELNHSVTPGGHRVTVYWDAYRLIKGEDWEDGFSTGLLNSLCFLPLMSYGSTAPLATLPNDPDKLTMKLAEGWELQPVGQERLEGLETDRQDNVLKELLIARALLQQTAECSEQGVNYMLRTAFPVLVGRQHPKGHPKYPLMGNFFHVQGGGGKYPKHPSPPTARAVEAFLSGKAGMDPKAAKAMSERSVESAVLELTKLQGCQLWTVPKDLEPVQLTREQVEMVGRGYTGPYVDLDGEQLSLEERHFRAKTTVGLDELQLSIMKAQVRAKLCEFHEVIDRAVTAQAAFQQSCLVRNDTVIDQDSNGCNASANFAQSVQSDLVTVDFALGWG